MFMHNKRLQYTVRVGETNPALASLLLEQFGGAEGELAAAMRYFTQALGEDDPGRKDMLLDIATEELSHLEVIGIDRRHAEQGRQGAALRSRRDRGRALPLLTAGGDSHTQTQLLYGGGPALTNSGGVPWTAAYIDMPASRPATCAPTSPPKARAKIIYERLINVTDDPGIKDALGFLMTREIAHQQSFEKALYSIDRQLPLRQAPGHRAASPTCTSTSRRAKAT